MASCVQDFGACRLNFHISPSKIQTVMPDVSSEICPNVARTPGGVIAGYRAVSVLEMASMLAYCRFVFADRALNYCIPNTSAHWYTASVFLMKASRVLVVISLVKELAMTSECHTV